MIDVVKYKGYYGVVVYSYEEGLYYAEVVGIGNSLILCHGDTLDQAMEEFKVSIDFHLEISESEGWPPCATEPEVAREMETLINTDERGGIQTESTHKQLVFAH